MRQFFPANIIFIVIWCGATFIAVPHCEALSTAFFLGFICALFLCIPTASTVGILTNLMHQLVQPKERTTSKPAILG
ncbi:hypothetical protein [Desulfuromonas acetoxidans]|uniref:hypothetical protein n=1 Tax=Desulfuromonas acetoxidans TaxID=891 RepID=UPI002930A5E9|nr:hypothetical protein [Desulfuromonas acetoxidans]